LGPGLNRSEVDPFTHSFYSPRACHGVVEAG
jgi:hypothetical protein